MSQQQSWNNEYAEMKLISCSDKPQSAFLTYLRYLRKSGVDTHSLRVLDLGSGTGKNSIYLASLGNDVQGFEFSANALQIARARSKDSGVSVKYLEHNIGSQYPLADGSIDLVIDVTASNSLSEAERVIYIDEVGRVLRPGGHFFVRALLKDGDKNAQNLLRLSPGPEKDTYYMKELGLTERVFSRSDFEEMYGAKFEIQKIITACGRATVDHISYKRRYLIAYLIKRSN